MKKIYSLLVAAAMVLGATSCQQEAIEEVAANEPASFTATLNATRTELGEGNKVMWNADDKITIYTQENLAGVTFDGDATAAASTATFTTTAEFTPSDNGYFAVYPYGKTNWSGTTVPEATYTDGVWSVPTYISEEQTGVIGSFDEAYNYMAAYSTSNKLSFKAATALIKFTYTGSQGYVGFNAQGASLCGENTMNYNTETGKITYSDEGSYTSIYLNDLVKGETYYIAIYPGKVSNFNIKEGWQTTLFSYDKEYTFEAGKIYSIKMGEPSEWVLYGLDGTMTPMFIEDGYHVAKNVAYNESSYVFQNTVSYDMLTCAEEVAPRTWQATAAATESGFLTNCDYADVYLTADLSKMCVVPAGEAMPELFVPEQTTWAVCGDLNSWGDTFMYTTPTENLFVAKDISLTAYSPFKIRKNSAWTINYGGNYKYGEPNKYMSVWKDGQDMAVTQTGTYDIYFQYISSNEGKIYVVTAGEDYTTAVAQTAEGPMPNPTGVVFGLVGAHNGWGSNDIKMALDETLNAYVAKSATLTGEFKIRGNESWSTFNYGAASSGTVTVGKGISVSNGSNTNLKVASGTYDVYFSYAKNMVWVMNVGEVPADL